MILLFIVAFLTMFWTFLHCLLGKLVTDRIDQLSNHLFHSKWHNAPIKLQKDFILLLANKQKPPIFHGLGIYFVDLETFTSVSEVEIRRFNRVDASFRFIENDPFIFRL